MPTGVFCRRLMSSKNRRAQNMYRSSRWGALRLWAAAFPFPRIGEPSPLPARLSIAFRPHCRRPSSAVCANARRNESGLRFPASYSVAGCKPLTSYAMGLRRVPALYPRFPTLSGLRYAPPRQPKPTHPRNAPSVDISIGRVSRFTSRLQHTRFEKAHTEHISVGRVSRFTSRLQHTRFGKAHTENKTFSKVKGYRFNDLRARYDHFFCIYVYDKMAEFFMYFGRIFMLKNLHISKKNSTFVL